MLFDDAAPYVSTSTLLTGESSSTSPAPTKFLSTGVLSGETALSGSASFAGSRFFYTTPNNNVSTGKTKLVIKGSFDPDGAGATPAQVVYYPVKLNSNVTAEGTHAAAESGTTEYQVYPNKNYKCSVTIKTIGSTGPDADIDPTTATVTITVTSFTSVSQSTIFQ